MPELVSHGPGLYFHHPPAPDFAYLYILLATVHWLLGSSHFYSLLLALNLLLISPVVPASFNYINICYSQMKKEKKKKGKKSAPGTSKGQSAQQASIFWLYLNPPFLLFQADPLESFSFS